MHYVVKVKQGKEVMTINTQIVAAIKKGKGIVRRGMLEKFWSGWQDFVY